jgi:plastocyanin
MNRTRMLAAAGIAALAAGLFGAAGAGAAVPKLVASVSDPLNISLTKGGVKVAKLKAGKYTIVVQDKASDHNFRLTGPGGVNKATSVKGKGTTTWTVTLKKGTYTYVCDPHKAFMKGSFTVS